MIINKRRGNWGSDGQFDYLDDVAYELYVQYSQSRIDVNLNFIPDQYTVYTIYHHSKIGENDNNFINDFYNRARLIIRKEKLEKIEKYV